MSGADLCQATLCNRPAKPGFAFCSALCAPTGHLGLPGATFARETGRSGSAERGAPSRPSAGDEKPTAHGTKNAGPYPVFSKRDGSVIDFGNRKAESSSAHELAEETTSESESSVEKSESEIENGTPETASERSLKSSDVAMPATLPESSAALEKTSPPEGSTTRNLIEESVQDLRDMMRSAAKVVRRTTRKDGSARLDPQLINAASNCSKQIASLMRLQLDWSKHVHGAEMGKEE